MAKLSEPTPELTLVAACDLAGDDRLAVLLGEAERQTFDWTRFERLARSNEMGGLVCDRLTRIGATGPAATVARALRPDLSESALLEMAQTSAATQLTARFAEAGLRTIILKGTALGHQLYPDRPHVRRSSDIDVLIASGDLDAADSALAAIGWKRRWPAQDAWPRRGRDMFQLLANVFEYTVPGTDQLLELHHRITLNPAWVDASFDDLHAHGVDIATASGIIHGLDGAQLVSYLCWHAFAHLGFRMKWFCDIARSLARSGAQSCAQLCPADQGYAPGPVALADDLLLVINAAVRSEPQVEPHPRWRRQVARILADMEDPRPVPTRRSLAMLPREAEFRLFLMGLSPGLRGKAYEALRALADPRDVSRLGLGKQFAPLYALLGPLFAAYRFATLSGPVSGPVSGTH